ncbi:retinitis pigmentosa 1-like 1 protein [Corythoichthys intestinalis]|uniref:retinitis pigmentosa 1-like 1 protein n=1 Tax=Corythoichthys intestinalis TaxID=161448 RepID=UPI0025A56143|nr:retinitis pigmentosa 1-like 1 protein [Corythoichthys intestinalis]
MMSYLWILLLFCLLAGRANTQGEEGDVAPTEESAVPTILLPESEEHSELEVEAVAEEVLPESDPEPTEAAAHEQATPAEVEAEPEAPSEAETEPEGPEGDAQPEATVEEEPEATAEEEPEVTDKGQTEAAPEEEAKAGPEVVPEAEEATVQPTEVPEAEVEPSSEPELETTVEPASTPEPEATTQGAEPDTPESGAAPSNQDLAADPEDLKPAQEIPDVDAQPTALVDSSNPHDQHGFKDEGTVGADAAAPHDESAHADVEVDVSTKLKAKVPSDGGLNLEDALSQGEAQDTPAHSGRSKSAGSVAHIAEATGEDADSEESGSGSLAAILCAVGVAVVGAVAAYFTYQKKKLCFKNLHEEDPEAARKADTAEAQSDPQVLSNLLNSS